MTIYGVTGATGHLGNLVNNELLDRGVPAADVVAIVRLHEKAELGGPLVPVFFLVLSAFITYLLLTVLAVSLADQPRVRRALLRGMIDYKALEAAQKPAPPNPAPEAVSGG